jgi:hypothetical protein
MIKCKTSPFHLKGQIDISRAAPVEMHVALVDPWVESVFYPERIEPTLNSVEDTTRIAVYDTQFFYPFVGKARPLVKHPRHPVRFRKGEADIHKIRDHQFGGFREEAFEFLERFYIISNFKNMLDASYFNGGQ